MNALDLPQTTEQPSYFWNGFPIAAGALCVDLTAPVAAFSNGYGFTAESRLAIAQGDPVSFHNGYGYIDGRIVL